MKNKKIVVYILVGLLTIGLFGSCAIDKKCPAYTQATPVTTDRTV